MKKPKAPPVIPPPAIPPPERRLVVATIGAPHGVKGECRVKSFTADPLSLGDYGPLFLPDGRALEIIDGRPLKDDMLVVRFKGLADRDAVKALTGQSLVIDRENLPDTDDEDEFYHADLLGLPVTDGEGNGIGTILEIHNHGAGDLLVIRPVAGGATLLLPFTKVAVPVLDVPGRRVVIDPAFLAGPEKPPADQERDA